MKSIRLNNNGREALWRITDVDREKLFRLLFHRYPDSEWGTFFRFGYRRTRWGIVVTWVDALKPEAGDLDRNSPLVEFRPAYIRRALTALESDELGVGVIHSHPQDCAPLPSRADDDMDSYFAGEFERFGNGRPYASLIVARNANRKLSFSGRVFDRGDWLPVENCLVVGEQLLREKTHLAFERFAATHESAGSGTTQERLTQLLGAEAPQRLRNAVVGVVGCSGTGSPAIHLLARAEIGELVLVDPGQFKPSNHQRNHASRHADLAINPAPTKVALASRLVREISPATKITASSAICSTKLCWMNWFAATGFSVAPTPTMPIAPEYAVDADKQRTLLRIIQHLAASNGWVGKPLRIDVIAIDWWEEHGQIRPDLRHYIDAVRG